MLIVTAYKIPSLNELLSQGHWGHKDERKKAHLELLFGLRATATSSSTPTISPEDRNTLLTACDTLASYLETARTKSNYKSAKSKSKSLRSGPKSNSNLGNPR